MKGQNQLGTEPVGKLLLKLALPAISAQIVNALYNIVDRIYIGNMPNVGSAALTGVGVTLPVIMLISAFAALVGMGGAPRASIKMGAGDNRGAEKILGGCFASVLILSAALVFIIALCMKPMLFAFGAGDASIGYAMDYMGIYIIGTLFVQISLGLNSFISAQGFAKTSMMTVLIGAVLNIVLDPLFIYTFDMGVKGAALATILSQFVSAVWVIKFLCGKRSRLRIKLKDIRISPKILAPVFALGLSPFIMQFTESLVGISLNSSLQRLGGDEYVGAMTIINSVMMISMMSMQGLTAGAQPILSYNFGAKKKDRVKKTFKLLFIVMMVFSTMLWLSVMLFPLAFTRLFSDNTALQQLAASSMRIFLAGLFALGAQNACQQTFLALGQAKVSVFLALLRKIILLIPLIFILPTFISPATTGVFLAEPISDIIAATVTVSMFAVKFPKILSSVGD